MAWRQFVGTFWVGLFCCLLLVVGLNMLVLWRAGEMLPQDKLIALQRQTGGLYASASSNEAMESWFRLARYKAIAPEIIAFGSSRAHQFRQEHFTRPFANMGLTFSSSELPNIARALLATNSNLKIVLLGVDFWKIHPAFPEPPTRPDWQPQDRFSTQAQRTREQLRALSIKYLAGIPRLLLKKTLTLPQIYQILCRCDEHGTIEHFGAAAMTAGGGIDAAGSVHSSRIFDPPPAESFADLDVLERGSGALTPGAAIQPDLWKNFLEFSKILGDAGVKVIAFTPPVSLTLAKAMNDSGRYGVVDEMRRRIREFGLGYDFHDISVLGVTDCEMIDTIHPGEVLVMRMLNAIAAPPESPLRAFLNVDQLKRDIARYSGRVAAYDVPRSGDRSRRETDFLKLGCVKPAPGGSLQSFRSGERAQETVH